MRRTTRSLAAFTAVAGLAWAGTTRAETAFAVTQNGTLISFDTASPNALTAGFAITGLQANEVIHGIDFRPATGELYALGSTSRLYTLDTATGAATQVGSGPFAPALNGSSFGFDFNPVIDRIRVVSDVDKNYVLNPNDGTATGVTDLFYNAGDANETANPNVVNSAYTNSFAGTTSTQLYGIDTGLDILVTQANSAGTLQTVGAIGADVNAIGAFDISGATGDAFVAEIDVATSPNRTRFWTLDLNTGQGTFVGEVGGGQIVTALAVVPEPGSLALLGLAGLSVLRRRR
ncbi:MAG: DUF4394 domain-containing protein [Phycisphaeraceae bacterium]